MPLRRSWLLLPLCSALLAGCAQGYDPVFLNEDGTAFASSETARFGCGTSGGVLYGGSGYCIETE